ncbi:unnamed protein product [marine sediment metagenome]|uniref:F5/8 type C domain-containing protein n=1 Tax=marine sediment metagenome TaxID=412755 RepID=X0ZA22_9ZZZZ
MMSKKTFVISLIVFGLLINCFSFVARANPADYWLGISSAELDSHCGSNAELELADALDGTSKWVHSDHDGEAHWFILDLGQTYTIKKVRGRSNLGGDPDDVDIYVSDDKENWGDAVATNIATWQDTTEWVEVDSTDKDGRYIKVDIIGHEYKIPAQINWGKEEPYMTIFDAYGDVALPPILKASLNIINPYPENNSVSL